MKLNEPLVDKGSWRYIESFVQTDKQKTQPNRNKTGNFSQKTQHRQSRRIVCVELIHTVDEDQVRLIAEAEQVWIVRDVGPD